MRAKILLLSPTEDSRTTLADLDLKRVPEQERNKIYEVLIRKLPDMAFFINIEKQLQTSKSVVLCAGAVHTQALESMLSATKGFTLKSRACKEVLLKPAEIYSRTISQMLTDCPPVEPAALASILLEETSAQ